MEKVIKDVSGEGSVLLKKITSPLATAYNFISRKPETKKVRPTIERPSVHEELDIWDTYTSPLANEDRTISCPNAAKYGCKDLWVPDLYGEFCGVCENCGHHFPLEYEWYLKHLFDPDSIKVFNTEIRSLNPLIYPGYEERLV